MIDVERYVILDLTAARSGYVLNRADGEPDTPGGPRFDMSTALNIGSFPLEQAKLIRDALNKAYADGQYDAN